MGYELPDNFRRPYMAVGFSDFWKRWHISLSSWLRDYLYIPLGGNRMQSRWGVYRNLMLTMLLGGLWHGAAWHFVVWGGLHGTYLAIERALGGSRSAKAVRPAGAILLTRRLLVFHAIVLTWLVFRCETLADVGRYLQALTRFDAPTTVTVGMLAAAAVVAAGWLAQLAGELREPASRFLTTSPLLQGAAYAAAAVVIAVFNFSGPTPFIYFRF
jgi:D-alanyl-lipoteichoic acid acyltransferase DltB (MBOAT superfamily)